MLNSYSLSLFGLGLLFTKSQSASVFLLQAQKMKANTLAIMNLAIKSASI